MRAWRRVFLIASLIALTSACGDEGTGGSDGSAARPQTPARLQIVSPTPNEVTGSNVTVKLNLVGAAVVEETTGPLVPDKGHLHLSLDGQLVSMAYGTTQDLIALAQGPHSLQAEFVAIDHAPFANKVVAAVLFTVAPEATG